MTTSFALVHLIAQQVDIGAKLAGIGTQIVAILTGIGVTFCLAWILWALLKSLLKKPSWEAAAGIVFVGLLVVFLLGAAPDLTDAAYLYGQTFMDGTP